MFVLLAAAEPGKEDVLVENPVLLLSLAPQPRFQPFGYEQAIPITGRVR